MTLVIETTHQYKVLFEELAKEIGVSKVDEADNEHAVLNRIKRSYKQANTDERGDVELRTLDDFLKII